MSLCPASPSLQWVPWVAVPHLPRYYAPLRLPPAHLGSLRLSLASRYRACFTVFVVSHRAHGLVEAPRSRQGLWSPGPPFREFCSETGGSPKFPSYPSEDMPRSQTPVVSCALASIAHRIVAFRRMQTVGFGLDAAEAILLTTTIHISGLNDTACLLAHSSFVRPLLGWHAEFTTDLLARR
jgi:hypothetical protein